MRLSTDADGAIALAAEGHQAIVAFAEYWSGRVAYRITRTGGDTWSGRRYMTPPALFNGDPALALQGGVIRALFTANCTSDVWVPDCKVYYVRSLDGRSWTSPELVSHGDLINAFAGSVQFAGRALVTYSALPKDGSFQTFVRARSS
jgi:hypothetical protein